MGLIAFTLKAIGQEATADKIERGTPLEWGSAYKMETILVQEIKRTGLMSTPMYVSIRAIKNLATGNSFYYPRFEVFDGVEKVTKNAAITEGELEEAIGFCKNLSDYVQEAKIPNYTEYKYESKDGTFELGAYWDVKTIKWTFFVTIDPRARLASTSTFDTTYIAQLFQALMNCKATIERLKNGQK
jgi:hypothetical protein